MIRAFLITAAVSGAFFVGFGAYASHGLKAKLAEDAYEAVRTGLLYQIIHTLALILTVLWMKHTESVLLNLAAGFFIAGILLFSVSIYLYRGAGFAGFAPVTPFGGISFILGWLMLLAVAVKEG